MIIPKRVIEYSDWKSPAGTLLLAKTSQGVCRLTTPAESETEFFGALRRFFPDAEFVRDEVALKPVVRQLEEYFNNQRREFTCALDLKGTAFQLRVWQALREIPFGETRSYADVARMAGCQRGCRAVGQANGANPVSIIVPCHRVIAADGGLGGYGGGLEMKKTLLALEGQEPGRWA